jgi:hypothetical protein
MRKCNLYDMFENSQGNMFKRSKDQTSEGVQIVVLYQRAFQDQTAGVV